MGIDDFMEQSYEPDEDEIRELNEILKQEDSKNMKKPTNRLMHVFFTESHFQGWLRTNGILW